MSSAQNLPSCLPGATLAWLYKDLYKRFKKAVQEIQRKAGRREISPGCNSTRPRPLEAELGKNVVLEKKLETLAQQFDENLGIVLPGSSRSCKRRSCVATAAPSVQGSKRSSPKS